MCSATDRQTARGVGAYCACVTRPVRPLAVQCQPSCAGRSFAPFLSARSQWQTCFWFGFGCAFVYKPVCDPVSVFKQGQSEYLSLIVCRSRSVISEGCCLDHSGGRLSISKMCTWCTLLTLVLKCVKDILGSVWIICNYESLSRFKNYQSCRFLNV